eukprot:Blabericola_migrator_1__7857@NODE_4018_length_1379_cov_67_971799_g2477_i0_p2_GENE_NODE_4018_length_1379_cov_67_971799_g2477_i0NODE_4018_length_1379_cov_67_971799_g2477_i0_p2_ORF_typecomplete_len129_score8_94SUZ/PF12752_7/6_3_NODE_4018_length_1379_cov_67_971799_g2477_i0186572
MSQPPLMNWRAIAAPSSNTPPSAPPTAAATSSKKRITLLKRPKLPRGQAPSPDETPGDCSKSGLVGSGGLAGGGDVGGLAIAGGTTIECTSILDRNEGVEVDSEPDGARKSLSSKSLKERERAVSGCV